MVQRGSISLEINLEASYCLVSPKVLLHILFNRLIFFPKLYHTVSEPALQPVLTVTILSQISVTHIFLIAGQVINLNNTCWLNHL